MIRAGKLRQRVTIQREDSAQDAAGQSVPVWNDVARRVAAEVLGVAGGETIRGQQVEAHITSLVRLRYRSGLQPQMRIVHDGRNLHIDKVIDRDGMRRELELHCKEAAD